MAQIWLQSATPPSSESGGLPETGGAALPPPPPADAIFSEMPQILSVEKEALKGDCFRAKEALS